MKRRKQAVLFDAPNDTVGPLLDEVDRRGLKLIGLWLTHGHFDHLADHAVVTAQISQGKVLIHRLDEPKLQQPASGFFRLPFVIPSRAADGYVEDGQQLSIGDLQAEVIETPGHSPGHVMYYFAEQRVLMGGDLIIMGAWDGQISGCGSRSTVSIDPPDHAIARGDPIASWPRRTPARWMKSAAAIPTSPRHWYVRI